MSSEQRHYVVQRPDGVRSKKWSRSRIIQMFEAGKIPVSSVVISDSGKETDIELFAFLAADEGPVTRGKPSRPTGKPKPPESNPAPPQPQPPPKAHARVRPNAPPLREPTNAAAAFTTANNPQWYYQVADERYGPITMVELRELAQRGTIQPIDLIWKAGMPTAVPASRIEGVFPAAQQIASVEMNSPAAITVPLLISAISNILVGCIWVSTCFGIVIAVPMFVLSVYEFRLYAKIGTRPVKEIANEAGSLAIWEIVLGVFLNIPTLLCGIFLRINAGKFQ